MKLESLETPVPLVDLGRLASNLERMARYAAEHDLVLRPHVKTHKCTWIAAEQVRLGAAGLTCATTRELEVMCAAAADLLFAYPPVGEARLGRLMSLPDNVRLTVALDSASAITELALAARAAEREVQVCVEIDVGMGRVGVTSPAEAAELALLVRKSAPLRYAGIAFYPGHIRAPVAEQEPELEKLDRLLGSMVQELDRRGVRPGVVSGGSTPTAWSTHRLPHVTEMRPGTYVFNDRTTAEIGACEWEDCAFCVLATVVSTAVAGQAVVDAGSKSLGREPLRAEGAGFGVLQEHPEVRVVAMSEEHGILDVSRTTWKPEVGERVRIIPNHVCVALHLHDVVFGVRGGEVQASWEVEARGRGISSNSVAPLTLPQRPIPARS